MDNEYAQDLKRKLLIFHITLAFLAIFIIAAFLPVFIPSIKHLCFLTSGTCSIGISVINYIQFLSAFKQHRNWVVGLFILMLFNMFLGISKFV
jgi:uncharacterized membrane protein YhdT